MLLRVLNRKTDHVGRNAVYVGRPTKWGNHFADGTREENIARYRQWLLTERPDLVAQAKRELAGRDLVCWCAPQPCHAEILLEIANS